MKEREGERESVKAMARHYWPVQMNLRKKNEISYEPRYEEVTWEDQALGIPGQGSKADS